jgi:hypothetical protein
MITHWLHHGVHVCPVPRGVLLVSRASVSLSRPVREAAIRIQRNGRYSCPLVETKFFERRTNEESIFCRPTSDQERHPPHYEPKCTG